MIRFALLFAALVVDTFGCSCLPWTSQEAYCNADWVGTFKILQKNFDNSTMQLTYKVKVTRVFKANHGIPVQGATTTISTANQSAACGIDWLEVGKEYLLNGGSKGKLAMYLCGQIQTAEWNNISYKMKYALYSGSYKPCPVRTTPKTP
ncbi:hypothetical protein L596_017727 [Steinernema carpocapsae]|uniref:NTR domain-containing protein n=1 Tax=Steinernema carpocapsae TaxID=34508 RepID=A0A4U5N380_STECR|nr:hypothetical protein L596_017727 [Steinernema carpocapsae]